MPSSNYSSAKKAKIKLVFDDRINYWFDVARFRIFLSNGDCSNAQSFVLGCFVFVRNILINHLPIFLKERFAQFLNFDWIYYFKKHWIIVILSIIIGAYSHLFWDAFTHEWGYFAKLIPALEETWFQIPFNNLEVKGYKFLQHFSTFLGAIFIAFWMYKMPKQILPKTKFDYIFWLKVVLFSTIISTIRLVFFPIEIGLGNIIVVIGMSVFLSLVIFGVKEKYC